MPGVTGAVPKYRKHRTSGQAVVTLNGHDFYLGPHGTRTSKREYDRPVAAWLKRGRSPIRVDRDLTILELVAFYWKFAKAYYRKDGRSTGIVPGIECALRYVKHWHGRTPACEFGRLALKAVPLCEVTDDSGN